MKEITEQSLAELRGQVMEQMSPKRFRHTACVEDMVARLCQLFCPEQTNFMRAAALLHDVTKERSAQEQEQLSAMPTVSLPKPFTHAQRRQRSRRNIRNSPIL